MPGPVFLEGDAVRLRTVEEEDVEFLQETVNDPRVRTGIGAVDPLNREQEREWFESIGEDGGVNLLVCVDGDPVGTIGLQPPNQVWGVVEIGYAIAPEHWGNGYATDAVEQLCGYAFEERRLHKVHASVYETNPASARVLEKVGFEEEGVAREHAFVDGEYVDVRQFGLLADEFG